MRGNNTSSQSSHPYYIVLFAVYPALALLASNSGQVPLKAGLRSGVVLVFSGLIVFVFLYAIFRNATKAGIITALIQLLFFTYGHVMSLLEIVFIFKIQFGRHEYLTPLWLAFFILGMILILRYKRITAAWNVALNLTGVCLLLASAGQILYSQIHSFSSIGFAPASFAPSLLSIQDKSGLQSLPDVYYIVLDAYGREDALREDYGLDNTPFLDELRAMGFVIPECSQSNYSYTAMSLSSALHMNYLENFSTMIQQGDKKRNLIVYKDLIEHSPVRENFHNLGYTMVAFETGYWWADVSDADIYLAAPGVRMSNARRTFDLTGFEETLMGTTGLRLLQDLQFDQTSNHLFDFRSTDEQHYDTVRNDFNALVDLSLLRGPKFVYAHIVAPHPPFIIRPDGSFYPDRSNTGYPNEIQYLNGRVLEVVRQILKNASRPPIIIIQGDHGWDIPNRMKILNAYYFPGTGRSALYSTITPVNTFRLIFDQYFDGNYGKIDDISYFSTEDAVYQFTVESSTCVPGK